MATVVVLPAQFSRMDRVPPDRLAALLPLKATVLRVVKAMATTMATTTSHLGLYSGTDPVGLRARMPVQHRPRRARLWDAQLLILTLKERSLT